MTKRKYDRLRRQRPDLKLPTYSAFKVWFADSRRLTRTQIIARIMEGVLVK